MVHNASIYKVISIDFNPWFYELQIHIKLLTKSPKDNQTTIAPTPKDIKVFLQQPFFGLTTRLRSPQQPSL